MEDVAEGTERRRHEQVVAEGQTLSSRDGKELNEIRGLRTLSAITI